MTQSTKTIAAAAVATVALAGLGAALLPSSASAATLQVRYNFENVSGNSIPDDSGNGFTATFGGSGTISTDAAVGSQSAQLPFISMPNSTSTPAYSLPSNGFTIDTWLKLPLVSGALPNNIQAIFANSGGGFNTAGLRFYINDFNTANGKIVLETANGTAGTGMGSAPGAYPADGAWHNVALTFDNTTGAASAYVDGQLRAASTTMRTDFPLSTPSDYIGQFDGGAFGFHGLADDFRIYDGVLTQADIQALVPEPMTAGLLVLGGLALGLRRRRREI